MASRRISTDLGLRNLKPRAKEYEVSLGNKLYYAIQPSNRRSFSIRYRFPKQGGRTRQLGLEPGISLSAARIEAADAAYKLERGIDPADEKRKARQAQRLAVQDTVAAVIQEYLRREAGQLRTGDWRRRRLEALVVPVLGDRPIGEVRRTEIVRLFDQIEDAHGKATSDNVLATLRRVFHWHASRSDDFHSPIIRGMARMKAKDRVRTRILSDQELHAIVTTAEADGGPFALMVLFLLYSTARRNEANGLRWSEINGAVWTLPASRNKTKVPLVRPLGIAARDILAKLPHIPGCDLAFTVDGVHPLGGTSRRKKAFDSKCGVTNWRLHDLRRTSRSLMSRAGVLTDHAERCLGHALGGVRAVYDQHSYLEQMDHAYAALAGLIDRIAHPAANVVPIAKVQ
jgi:integrase